MSQLRPTVNLPKIAIPTGYEDMQRQAATKRKLADAMLGQGLAPQQGQNNWAQLFGQLAQAYGGKRLNQQATGLEKDMQTRLREDYTGAFGQLQTDVQAGMKPEELVARHGTNPLLTDALDPYKDAMATALREREKLQNFGGRAGVRTGDVMGQYENDPNKMVHVVDGKMQINPVGATAAAMASGNLVPEPLPGQKDPNWVTQAPFPGSQPPRQPPASAADVATIPSDMWQATVRDLGPEGAIRFAVSKGLAVPITGDEDFNLLPPGASFIGPDGVPRRKP